MPYLQRLADGALLLNIHVQPRASSNGIVGPHGDSLKVRLTSPPVDGKANKALLCFLAEHLHLPKSAFVIQRGLRGREKQIVLTGGDEDEVRKILAASG